jgi:hypothetical protein
MNINSQLDANQVMQLLGVSKFDQIKNAQLLIIKSATPQITHINETLGKNYES